MKKKNILIALLSMFVFGACNYLDFDERNGDQTKDEVYKYFDRTTNMLNNLYSYIPKGFIPVETAMLDCATDDAEFALTSSGVQDFNNGAWSALNTYDSQWNMYEGIRAANAFLVDIENVDFSYYQYVTDYNDWMKKLPYYKYQARLLRAYYFFELARRYGDIAMPTTVLTAGEANTIGKTSFDEVIRFVVEECDAVIPNLPVSYLPLPGKEIGRVTKGFGMALKTKALLYAASQLHNTTGDAEKWKSAALAAQTLIDSAEIRGWYQMDGMLSAVNNYESKEVILAREEGNSSRFEGINFPVRFTDGNATTTGVCPSQNLVDAFETANGYTVSLVDNAWVCADPDFDPKHPYDNRDPRLAKTVVTDGSMFKEKEIQTYKGGLDDAPVATGGSATGYFLRKHVQEDVSFDANAPAVKRHDWIVYRYAEALLSYAEAMTEGFGDPDYTDATYTRSARWALNQVRQNAGMPEVTTTGKEAFLERLRNEWRVEFAFEDHRFWDIRRWKMGADTQVNLYGVAITKADDGTKTYVRRLYENRTWNDRMYLYPIPQSELYINQNLAPQNPGW